MYVRQHTPLDGGEGTFSLTGWATSVVKPVGISNNRLIFYGADTNVLKQSVDEGVTWTTITVAGLPAGQINGLQETDDGEALLYISPTALPGRVYRSTGWTANKLTATWALVLTETGGAPNNFGLNCANFGSNKIVANTSKYGVIGCYGTQTPASGDATTSGRYVYWTENFGATWTQVFDLYTWGANTAGLHVHSAAYDPWWDRIWVAWGDVVMNGKLDVVYSDDHGVTWVQLESGRTDFTILGGLQTTTVLPRPNYILFGSDPNQGCWFVPRDGYRVAGKIQILYMNSGGTSNTSISTHMNSLRGELDAPVFHAWTTERVDMNAGFAVSYDDVVFQRAFDYPQASLKAINTVWGPSVKGNLLIGAQLSTTYYLLRGTLAKPESGTIIERLDAVGDAVITAFVVPHYQNRIPAGVEVFAQSSAALATNTVTVDATNVTVTFAVAPANAAIVQMAVRIRP